MKRTIGTYYVATGLGLAIVTVVVLAQEGKESPSRIAGYAAANGLLWPAALVAMARKKKELKLKSV